MTSFNSLFQQTALKNSNSIILNSNHGFVAGDWIRISQVDSDLVYSSWAIGSVGQIVQIDQVSGDTLLLHSHLRMNYDLSRYPKVTKLIPNAHVGIRCLSIERMDDTAPEQASSISFTNTVHSYIDGISSVKCTFAHVELSSCSNVAVRRSFLKMLSIMGKVEERMVLSCTLQQTNVASRIIFLITCDMQFFYKLEPMEMSPRLILR